MKNLVLIVLIILNFNCFSQNCIPGPSLLSRNIMNCLQQNNSNSLLLYSVNWQDIKPLFDSMIVKKQAVDSLKELPSEDSARKDVLTIQKEIVTNADSLLARSNRLKISWNPSLTKDNDFTIDSNSQMLDSGNYVLKGRLSMVTGDSIVEIKYDAMLTDKGWKLLGINDKLWIYDKQGNVLGIMTESIYNFTPPRIVKEETIPGVKRRPIPGNKKTSVKK